MKYLFLASLILVIGCTNVDKTVQTLKSSGYSDIQIKGYAWFACGKDDTYATNFSAKNPLGRTVSGVVCCGLVFKGCTVRF